MPKLGEVVRRIREDANLSRHAVARAAKIDPSILFHLEQDPDRDLRFSTLCALADALGVSLDDLAIAAGLRKKATATQGPIKHTAGLINLRETLEKAETTISEAVRQVRTLDFGAPPQKPKRVSTKLPVKRR